MKGTVPVYVVFEFFAGKWHPMWVELTKGNAIETAARELGGIPDLVWRIVRGVVKCPPAKGGDHA